MTAYVLTNCIRSMVLSTLHDDYCSTVNG